MVKAAFIVAAVFWILDAAATSILQHTPLWQSILQPDTSHLLSRSFVAATLFVFIGLLHIRFIKQREKRKALYESQKLYKLLAENVNDVIWTMDLNLRYTYISPSIKTARGFSPDELIGRSVKEVMSPEGFRKAKKLLEEELAKDPYSDPNRCRIVELELPTKDGGTMWAEQKMIFLRDESGRPVGILGVSRDITERRRVQEELERHKNRLNELVQERTKELMETNIRLQKEIAERKQAEEKLRDYQKRLRRLASEVTFAEERERRRIAVELHDNLGQMLAVAKMRLGTLAECAGQKQKEVISEIRALLERSIEFTRSLTIELSPPVLYELGLEPAVEWLLERVRKEHNLKVSLQTAGASEPLDENARVLLFKATRELLLNIVKHADATEVQVTISRDNGCVRFVVEDDGKGFDPESLRSSEGFGLFSIKERLNHIGGRMELFSTPGKGTRVELLVPLGEQGGNDNDSQAAYCRRPQDSA